MKKVLFVLLCLFFRDSYSQDSLTHQLKAKKDKSAQKMSTEIKVEFTKALKQLKDSGIEAKAIKKGATAPIFKINKVSFQTFYSKKPVILKFYRGSWCPYCQLEMKAYQKYKSKMEKKGYQIIVLTPDTPKEIKKFKAKQKISFNIYQDKENAIAKKFGISFKLNTKVSKIYKGFGINLKQSQNNDLEELPLPGTYVINRKGVITYAFIDADYTIRLDPEELLDML